ncbi:MAG: hypothetical protein H0X45_06290 [Planctomycetes bacterium]|nr:hypothetical protein [Planctomycetota bacterium]
MAKNKVATKAKDKPKDKEKDKPKGAVKDVKAKAAPKPAAKAAPAPKPAAKPAVKESAKGKPAAKPADKGTDRLAKPAPAKPASAKPASAKSAPAKSAPARPAPAKAEPPKSAKASAARSATDRIETSGAKPATDRVERSGAKPATDRIEKAAAKTTAKPITGRVEKPAAEAKPPTATDLRKAERAAVKAAAEDKVRAEANERENRRKAQAALKSPFSNGELKEWRTMLLERRTEISSDIRGLVKDAMEAEDGHTTPNHIAERGSDADLQDMSLTMAGDEEAILWQIDRALRKIDKNSPIPFGLCEYTKSAIAKTRLQLIPWTPLSIEGATHMESNNMQIEDLLVDE